MYQNVQRYGSDTDVIVLMVVVVYVLLPTHCSKVDADLSHHEGSLHSQGLGQQRAAGHPKAPLGTHRGEFASWRPTEVFVGQVGPSLAAPGAAGVRWGLEATSDKPSATRPRGQQQSCGDRPCILLTAEQGATDTSDITHARLLQERCLVV